MSNENNSHLADGLTKFELDGDSLVQGMLLW